MTVGAANTWSRGFKNRTFWTVSLSSLVFLAVAAWTISYSIQGNRSTGSNSGETSVASVAGPEKTVQNYFESYLKSDLRGMAQYEYIDTYPTRSQLIQFFQKEMSKGIWTLQSYTIGKVHMLSSTEANVDVEVVYTTGKTQRSTLLLRKMNGQWMIYIHEPKLGASSS